MATIPQPEVTNMAPPPTASYHRFRTSASEQLNPAIGICNAYPIVTIAVTVQLPAHTVHITDLAIEQISMGGAQ